jgi:hypothetical protein
MSLVFIFFPFAFIHFIISFYPSTFLSFCCLSIHLLQIHLFVGLLCMLFSTLIFQCPSLSLYSCMSRYVAFLCMFLSTLIFTIHLCPYFHLFVFLLPFHVCSFFALSLHNPSLYLSSSLSICCFYMYIIFYLNPSLPIFVPIFNFVYLLSFYVCSYCLDISLPIYVLVFKYVCLLFFYVCSFLF